MTARRALIGSSAFILMASLVGGCADYDYLQHTDRISFRAGNAVKANLERETFDPSNGSMYDTSGLGKNGSVMPSGKATTTTQTPPTPTAAPALTPAAPL